MLTPEGVPVPMSLEIYERRFKALKVNKTTGGFSPHKVCMLFAVLDLARSGCLTSNEVRYGPELLERYKRYFNAVRGDGDHPNPHFPFFHLRGALRGGEPSFWHLVPLPGSETIVEQMGSARTDKEITERVAHARLDDELFDLLQDERNIDALAAALSEHWFKRGLEDLETVVREERRISLYERQLRALASTSTPLSDPGEAVRSPAFRRVVLQNYDYRCAASGVRVVLPDGTAMAEAAHIHPFSMSADDDPRNGLALTPDMHWAMDNWLISPRPDLRWEVHRGLDERISDHAHLVRLQGRPLLLPRDSRYYPKQEVLVWRHERFRRLQA